MTKRPKVVQRPFKTLRKDEIGGPHGLRMKHPFSQGFQGDSDRAGKRKIRKTK